MPEAKHNGPRPTPEAWLHAPAAPAFEGTTKPLMASSDDLAGYISGRIHEFCDYVELDCTNCGTKYSANTPRVQRALKQINGLSRAKLDSTTPKLCWVCAHLLASAHQKEGDVQVLVSCPGMEDSGHGIV